MHPRKEVQWHAEKLKMAESPSDDGRIRRLGHFDACGSFAILVNDIPLPREDLTVLAGVRHRQLKNRLHTERTGTIGTP